MSADVSHQPVFLLFIAATVLLCLGFAWGRRRNHAILRDVMDALEGVLQPVSRRFTNIGGSVGTHAAFELNGAAGIGRVEITVILLPRQAVLYLPFSFLIRRGDMLYLSFEMVPDAVPLPGEGHWIDMRYRRRHMINIANEDRLSGSRVEWRGAAYNRYEENDAVRAWLESVREAFGDRPAFRHLALVPERRRVFVAMRAAAEAVRETLPPLVERITALAGPDGTNPRSA